MKLIIACCALTAGLAVACGHAPGPLGNNSSTPKPSEGIFAPHVCGDKGQPNPLIVDWPSQERMALEAQLQRGLVAVSYSGCSLKVLPHCKVPGAYKYASMTRQAEHLTMRNADELYAAIPAYAATFEGRMRSSGQLVADVNMVGVYQADHRAMRQDELQSEAGSCDGATHLVTGIVVGEFEFFAGSEDSAGAKASALGASAGGTTSRAKEVLNQAGAKQACDRATKEDASPPFNCGALLRLELLQLGKPASALRLSFLSEKGQSLVNNVGDLRRVFAVGGNPPGIWGIWRTMDLNGGQLEHGDRVTFLSQNGQVPVHGGVGPSAPYRTVSARFSG